MLQTACVLVAIALVCVFIEALVSVVFEVSVFGIVSGIAKVIFGIPAALPF